MQNTIKSSAKRAAAKEARVPTLDPFFDFFFGMLRNIYFALPIPQTSTASAGAPPRPPLGLTGFAGVPWVFGEMSSE